MLFSITEKWRQLHSLAQDFAGTEITHPSPVVSTLKKSLLEGNIIIKIIHWRWWDF